MCKVRQEDFCEGLVKEVIQNVYGLKGEYWHLETDAIGNEDGTWDFLPFKAGDTESEITVSPKPVHIRKV